MRRIIALCGLIALLLAASGCGGGWSGRVWKPRGIGVGGRYNDAIAELRRPSPNLKKATADLEYVVREDPFYRDGLAQLGRAYYMSGRYDTAFEVLKRAVAVNKNDEIAWMVLGLTQMRLGDDEKGLESFKGGLTLFIKASQHGYQDVDYDFWDTRGVVRRTVRRTVFVTKKGVEEKNDIIRIGELLLRRIYRELYAADYDQDVNKYEYDGDTDS